MDTPAGRRSDRRVGRAGALAGLFAGVLLAFGFLFILAGASGVSVAGSRVALAQGAVAADVSVRVDALGSSAYPGYDLAYALRVGNRTGSGAAGRVVLTQTLPVSTSFVAAATPSGAISPIVQDGSRVVFDLGALAAGTETVVTATLRLDVGAAPYVRLATAAEAFAAGQPEAAPDDNAAANRIYATYPAAADLWVVLSVAQSAVEPGGLITYRVDYGSFIGIPAGATRLTSTLPAGVSLVGATPPPTITSGRQAIWTFGDLSPGSEGVLTVVGRADAALAEGASICAGAEIAGAVPDLFPAGNVSEICTPVRRPHVGVAVATGPRDATAIAGAPADRWVQLRNVGAEPVAGVVVTATLPPFFTWTGGWHSLYGRAYDVAGSGGQVVIRPRDPLAPFFDDMVSLHGAFDALAAGSAVTQTVVARGTPDDDPTDDADVATTAVVAPAVDLLASVWVEGFPPEVATGQVYTYALYAYNYGPSPAHGVRLTVTMPASVAYLGAASAPNGSPVTATASGSSVILAVGGRLPAGADELVLLRVRAESALTQTVLATAELAVSADERDVDPANNRSRTSILLVPPPVDLALAATVSPPSVVAGSPLTFTMVYSNVSVSAAAGVRLTATVPLSLTAVGAEPAPAATAPGRVIWDLGTVGAESGGSVALALAAPATLPSAILILAADVGTQSADRNLQNNSGATALDVWATTVDVWIAVSHPGWLNPAPPLTGRPVTFSIEYGNDGTTPAAGAVLTETLPAQLTYVSHRVAAGPAMAVSVVGNAIVARPQAGSLATGQPGRIELVALVAPGLTGTLAVSNAVSVATASEESRSDGFPLRSNRAEDVVQLIGSGLGLPFFDDFEGPPRGWAGDGFWHAVADPQTIGVLSPAISPTLVTLPDGRLPSAWSGRRAWWYGEDATGTYAGADFGSVAQTPLNGGLSASPNRGSLTTPSVDLSGAASATLSFRTWWEVEGGDPDRYDQMAVLASADGGASWSALGRLNPLRGVQGAASQPTTSAGVGEWVEVIFDLSPYAGQPNVQVRFDFDTDDQQQNGFRGWLVDDVGIIAGPPAASLAVAGLVPRTVPASNAVVVEATGSGFVQSSQVWVNGLPAVTAVLNVGRLQFTAPSALVTGTYPVTVAGVAGQVAGAGFLTVTATPRPALGGIVPSGGASSTPAAVRLYGTSFQPGLTAAVGGLPLANVTVVSAIEVSATVPAGLPPGRHTAVVTNPDGQSDTLALAYEVAGPPTTVLTLDGDGSGEWFRSPVTATLAGLWGSPPVATWFSLDGCADPQCFAPYQGPFAVVAEGAHLLRFYSSDAAGATEPVQQRTFAIDRTPPAVAVQRPAAGTVWWEGGAFDVRWDAADLLAGVPVLRSVWLDYSIDGGLRFTPIAGPLDNTGGYRWRIPAGLAGSQVVVRARAADGAGNVAEGRSAPFAAVAAGDQAVMSVAAVNVADVSFTLAFVTRQPAIARAQAWISGTTPAGGVVAADFRLTSGPTHFVRVGGADGLTRLLPETTYAIAISLDDALTPVYTTTVRTGPTLDRWTSAGAFGRVLGVDGAPAAGALVQATVDGAAPLAAVTDADGYWWIDLASARTLDLSGALPPGAGRRVHLVAADGLGNVALADPPADFVSPLDLRLRPLLSRAIGLGVGWNAVALPIEPARPISVTHLAQALNGDGVRRLVGVFRYRDGGWQGAGISGTAVLADDFPLLPGEGYFVQVSQPAEWSISGFAIDPVPLALAPGWNLVGIPAPAGLDAATIVAQTTTGTPAVHNVGEVDRWIYGSYEGHVAGYPFNVFPIENDRGYFLRVRNAGVYQPGTVGYQAPP